MVRIRKAVGSWEFRDIKRKPTATCCNRTAPDRWLPEGNSSWRQERNAEKAVELPGSTRHRNTHTQIAEGVVRTNKICFSRQSKLWPVPTPNQVIFPHSPSCCLKGLLVAPASDALHFWWGQGPGAALRAASIGQKGCWVGMGMWNGRSTHSAFVPMAIAGKTAAKAEVDARASQKEMAAEKGARRHKKCNYVDGNAWQGHRLFRWPTA